MVQWKGKLEGDVGSKAENLEKLEGFKIPNFFVITPEESSRLFKGAETAEEVLNTGLESRKREEIKNAYKEIGMSSEVRTAAGKAKSLVGGQRNGQKVSIRISDHGQGMYEYRLNIGSSGLFNALKQVAASYYKERDGHPSIIVQKMVEPDYTGAVVADYSDGSIVEVVEGLGHSLERGTTEPFVYLFQNSLEDVLVPKEHLKITRNPMNGENRRKKLRNPGKPFSEQEISNFHQKVFENNASVKFVYKRGSFYIVDAWRPEDNGIRNIMEFEGLKVSPGDISGVVGKSIIYSDSTHSPDGYEKVLIADKGGYTSTDAQKARRDGKAAVFSYKGDINRGETVNKKSEYREEPNNRSVEKEDSRTGLTEAGLTTGSEVLPLNPSRGRGLYTEPPFGEGYQVSRRGIPEENYLETCSDVFRFQGEKVVLDTRRIDSEAVENVIEYIDAEFKAVIFEQPDLSEVLKAVENGFELFVSDKRSASELREKVFRAEKRFIMDKLREN